MIHLDKLSVTVSRGLNVEGARVEDLKLAGASIGQTIFTYPVGTVSLYRDESVDICFVEIPPNVGGMVIQCSYGAYTGNPAFKIADAGGGVVAPFQHPGDGYFEHVTTGSVYIKLARASNTAYNPPLTMTVSDIRVVVSLF